MSDDLFNAANAVSVQWHKWANVGDTIQGVYVEHKEVDSDMTSSGKQHVYVLMVDGQAVNVPGPGGRELKPVQPIPLGAYIGIKFDAEIPAEKKGWNPTKQIGVYWNKRMELDILTQYQGGVAFTPDEAVQDNSGEGDDLPPM